MTDSGNPGQVYAVRPTEGFANQSEAAYNWLERIDVVTADQWKDNLDRAVASLAPLPRRYSVARENRAYQKQHPGPALHAFLYQHGRTTWHLLFTVHEAEGEDQPYVKLHQLRNAAQKPMTKWPDEA